jgi:hypothetical protein
LRANSPAASARLGGNHAGRVSQEQRTKRNPAVTTLNNEPNEVSRLTITVFSDYL